MRIQIDRTKCSGIGLCEMTAPSIFEIGDDGQSHVINPDPAEEDRRTVEEAVSSCPTGAVSLDG